MKVRTILTLAAICVSVSAFAQTDAQYNQYGQKVESDFVSGRVQDGILVFQNKSAGYKFWFSIFVQGDAAVYFGQDENLVQIGNGMNIRRSRFSVQAQIDKNWYGEIDTDWTSGTPELRDAILEYTGVKNLSIKFGNFDENFSLQSNSSSRYLQFLERPMACGLAPSRHLGVNVKYSTPLIWASAGVFGPELRGSKEMTHMEDGNKDYGLDEGLSYTGKLVFRPLYKSTNSALHIGGAFSYREPKLSNTNGYNTARYSSRNSTSINRKKFLDTGVISNVDHEIAYTAEVTGHWKGLRAEAAYISRQAFLMDDADPKIAGAGGLKPADGWYVQAGWLLFGGHQNYSEGSAKYTRITPGQSWGDIELCLRYETADYNISEFYMGGSAQAFAVGLNYYPTKNVKFVINYQYNMNDKYANGAGKYNTGYDVAGNVCDDPSKIVDGGIDYSMLACRFQVAF